MSPSDDKNFPVASKQRGARFRRSVSVDDFTLPKPYLKKPFVEDEPETSKGRIALMGLSGIAAAGMLAMLALVARDSLVARPVLVIAAPLQMAEPAAPPAPPPKARAAASEKPALKSSRPALAALGATELAPPRVASRPLLHAVAAKLVRPVRVAVPKPEPAPQDPDVDLITAILMLSPPVRPEPAHAAAVCTPESPYDTGCPLAAHGVAP